jgi:methylated-DNA-[protein]-cysteine S-methyltransferase
MNYAAVDSPIGPLLAASDGTGLRTILFAVDGRPASPGPGWCEDRAHLAPVLEQLEAYFAGSLEEFDLELSPRGTDFQLLVWRELLTIGYGETMSYSELARLIGRPRAVRAVGAANGANPLPIVIPCHRVIGASGSLVGYGGGLEVKRWLLDLERGGVLPF